MFNIKKTVLVLSLISVTAFPVIAKSSVNSYKSSDGYSINYPASWTQQDQKSTYNITLFKSPPESETDDFAENVNVVVEKAPNLNLNKYYTLAMSMMNDPKNPYPLQDFKILKTGDKTVNKMPAKYLIYSHNYAGKGLEVKTYIFYKNNNGYVLTCTATNESFPKYEATFDQIVSTFKIN